VNQAYAMPLRAVDQVQVTRDGEQLSITATKEITVDDPYLAAHFPDRTVYPGVFIVETLRQAVVAALGERDGVLPEIVAVHTLRLVGAVHPGDRLCLAATVHPSETDGAIRVEAHCRRPDDYAVARMVLEFRYDAEGDPDV
jgi:3-hydroxyacyl-[acyl-carrier-protein] dehydratase